MSPAREAREAKGARARARTRVRFALVALSWSIAAVVGLGPRDARGDASSANVASSPSPAASASAANAGAPKSGEDAFNAIARVLFSPRCMNCHPAGDAPLNTDRSVAHQMNISRKSLRGLNCTTCHRNENGKAPHSPPGAPNWRLPDADMPLVFQGKTNHQLCEQLKDPNRNGHKTLEALREHMAHDPFVLWGWRPGAGRTTPPLSHDELMMNVDVWIAEGAPCPT